MGAVLAEVWLREWTLGRELAREFVRLLVYAGLGSLVDEVDPKPWERAERRIAILSRWADRLEAMLPAESSRPDAASDDVRPADRRDHLFLKWRDEGLTPADIRDRWNDMSQDERREIAPQNSRPLAAKEQGRQVVRAALRRASSERSGE